MPANMTRVAAVCGTATRDSMNRKRQGRPCSDSRQGNRLNCREGWAGARENRATWTLTERTIRGTGGVKTRKWERVWMSNSLNCDTKKLIKEIREQCPEWTPPTPKTTINTGKAAALKALGF